MKKLYFVGLGAFFIGCFLLLLKFGVGPRPIKIMKPSYFDNPQEIGAVVYRKFFDPLGREEVVFIGVPSLPVYHKDVVVGFLKAAELEKRPYDVLLFEPGLPDLGEVPAKDKHEFSINVADLQATADALKAHTSQGKKVLVYTSSVYTTHLIKGGPIHRLEQIWGKPIFSITSAGFVTSAKEEFKIDPPCVGGERDQTGTAGLGCTIAQTSRTIYRKELPRDRFVSVMNQHGNHDYLLLTAEPEAKTAAR